MKSLGMKATYQNIQFSHAILNAYNLIYHQPLEEEIEIMNKRMMDAVKHC